MTWKPGGGHLLGPEGALPHLPAVLRLKYGPPERLGWRPRLRRRFGYRTPDDWYEATVTALVGEETLWLDVGCGREVFPSNPAAARLLAGRCRLLAGVDPGDNIDDNRLLHDRAKCTLEAFRTERTYDLITLRMVAEHIAHPRDAVAALARLAKPGGRVVVYTVWKWSPAAIAAAVTPMAVHHRLKKLLWNTAERDSFPTTYRMNTRGTLRRLFEAAGFVEDSLHHLDDTRALARWKVLAVAELSVWKLLRAAGLPYPERCLLGVYRRQAPAGAAGR